MRLSKLTSVALVVVVSVLGLASRGLAVPQGDVPPDVEFGVAAAPWPA